MGFLYDDQPAPWHSAASEQPGKPEQPVRLTPQDDAEVWRATDQYIAAKQQESGQDSEPPESGLLDYTRWLQRNGFCLPGDMIADTLVHQYLAEVRRTRCSSEQQS
jgi:hypothetical protein